MSDEPEEEEAFASKLKKSKLGGKMKTKEEQKVLVKLEDGIQAQMRAQMAAKMKNKVSIQ